MQITSYRGFDCFFTNSSYNCPKLSLFGFSTDRALWSAIRRKLKQIELACDSAK